MAEYLTADCIRGVTAWRDTRFYVRVSLEATMYFSFDGNTEGFEEILSRIADNHDGGKHNHKEVRAYARCLLSILPEINCGFSVKPEVQILLAALTASGLPHARSRIFSYLHPQTIIGVRQLKS